MDVGNKRGEEDDGGRGARCFSGNDSGSWRHHPHQFAEEQQKLEEKVVENQAEDEVESHVDEAKELQDQRTRFRW